MNLKLISPSLFISQLLAKEQASRALQIAGFVRFLLILLQGIILVKAGVDIATVGQIEFVLFFLNFLSFFFVNGGRNAILSIPESLFEGESEKLHQGAFFASFHFFALVSVLALLLLIMYAPSEDFALIGSPSAQLALGLFLFFAIGSGPLEYCFLRQDRLRKMIWVMGLTQALQLLAVVAPLLLGYSLADTLWVLVVATGIRYLIAAIDLRWFLHVPARAKIMLFMGFSLPLILHAGMGGIMDYVDNWIVSWYYGDAQFAIYRYGARELPINALLIGGLTGGLIREFRRSGGVSDITLKDEISRLMRTLFPLTAVLLLISPILYQLAYSQEFIQSARIFNIYAFTLASRVIVNQVYLYHDGKNWILFFSAFGEVLLNILLSLVFLQWIGLLGIPIATAVAFFAHRVFMVSYVYFRYKTPPSRYIPLRSYCFFSLLIVVSFVLSEYLYF